MKEINSFTQIKYKKFMTKFIINSFLFLTKQKYGKNE